MNINFLRIIGIFKKNLIVGSFCTSTFGPYTNRILNLISDTILSVDCWGSCLSCSSNNTADLTLSVNTGNILVGPNGMYLEEVFQVMLLVPL